MASRLGVSTSGFYDWQKRQRCPSERWVEGQRLTETIKAIHARSRGTYGSPRVWAELRYGMGIRVGRTRVERLMRLAGITGIYRKDQGCLRNVGNHEWAEPGDVVTYGLHPHPHDPHRNITKLDFYGDREPANPAGGYDAGDSLSSLTQGKQILDEYLSSRQALNRVDCLTVEAVVPIY